MSASEFAGDPPMTADTDPALDPFREQVAFLRKHAAELETTDAEGLDAAVRYAKVRAGLDPDQAYPPAQWTGHLEPHWRRPFWESQVDRVVEAGLDRPRHTHFTRDIKSPGVCPRCDELRSNGRLTGQCPKCGRGKALVAVKPRPTEPGETTTYCRWDDCKWARVVPDRTGA